MIDLTKLVWTELTPWTGSNDPLGASWRYEPEGLNVVAGVKEVLPQVAQAVEWAVSR